jgi:site-specific recombinase XerD
MEEHCVTPVLQEFPQFSQWPFLSSQNQGVIADYLAYLRARHYGRAMQEGTLRALKSFAVLMPEARQATLAHDLTQTTAPDVDAWIEAAFRHPLAPSTVATRLRLLQGFFAFLHDQGAIAQSPIRLPRHHILVPQDLPRPMADDEVMAFFASSMPCGIARCFY